MRKIMTLLAILMLVVFMVSCENSINPTQSITQNDNAGISIAKGPVEKAKGPVEKATGNVMFYNSKTDWDEDGQFWNGIFNAHDSQKGSMTLNVIGADEFTPDVFTPDGVILKTFKYDVKYVNVDGINNEAYFAGICTSDYNTLGRPEGKWLGRWFVVRVVDGGTPGSEGDIMGWQWMKDVVNAETLAAQWVAEMDPVNRNSFVEIGNLQVHYYGE